MPFAFLTPLVLAAAGLIAVPWYLHHIRRPEREPVPFSSLIFVPDVKREVIERRRLQHLLLMLLRMLLLLLLALAFARPYIPLLAAATPSDGAARHVVLLDVSYSMADGQTMAAARDAARDVIDGLDADAQAALVTFAQTARVLAPLGAAVDARLALDAAVPTLLPTHYEAALRRAEQLLTEERNPADAGTLTVHLVSDFQRQGMPERHSGWKLPGYIQFDPVEVGAAPANWAVTDLDVRDPAPDRLQVRVKVKNWSKDDATPVEVRLAVGGEVVRTEVLPVAPGNASLATFDIPASRNVALGGWVETGDTGLTVDNRRYFAWSPRRKQRLLQLGGEAPDRRWTASALLRHAFPESANAPWTLNAPGAFEDADVALVTGGVDADTAVALRDHIEQGGQALIALADADSLEALLLELGVRVTGTRFADTKETQFTMLSWIDFEHPVFLPFQGARFNDFSDIRFHNHLLLELVGRSEGEAPRVLARFEAMDDGAGPPAMIESALGAGRVLIWSFPIDFAWTTFPKTPRFVPVLHETLAYLGGAGEEARDWRVGEQATPPWPGLETWRLSAETAEPERLDSGFLKETGFVGWRPDPESAWARLEPVNVDPREGDPARITAAEFALRLCSGPILSDDPAPAAEVRAAGLDAPIETWEYGRYIIAVLFAAMFFEMWYAGKLT